MLRHATSHHIIVTYITYTNSICDSNLQKPTHPLVGLKIELYKNQPWKMFIFSLQPYNISVSHIKKSLNELSIRRLEKDKLELIGKSICHHPVKTSDRSKSIFGMESLYDFLFVICYGSGRFLSAL